MLQADDPHYVFVYNGNFFERDIFFLSFYRLILTKGFDNNKNSPILFFEDKFDIEILNLKTILSLILSCLI